MILINLSELVDNANIEGNVKVENETYDHYWNFMESDANVNTINKHTLSPQSRPPPYIRQQTFSIIFDDLYVNIKYVTHFVISLT